MELYKGRPENVEGRLPREVRTYDHLDDLGIEYQRTDHERADNMEACNEIDAVLGVIICKNLFLCNRQKTKFYLLMMPGDKKFKTKDDCVIIVLTSEKPINTGLANVSPIFFDQKRWEQMPCRGIG